MTSVPARLDHILPAPILPGRTIGVMGSGQLGRMFAIAARRMGYRVHTFSPDSDTPTGQVSDLEVTAAYSDQDAVRAFASRVDVLTFEFENVPSQTVEWCAEYCPVRPSGQVLHICQHRLREKTFLAEAGLPIAPWAPVRSMADLEEATARIGFPAVLKTAAFGYDGKGQIKITAASHLASAWSAFGGNTHPQGAEAVAVLEGWVLFERELSVIVARGIDGSLACYPVCENRHTDHILDVTIAPAVLPPDVASRAQALAERVADALHLEGILAVEMFLLPDGGLLINELAPRPHNSGHFSFDASVTSQFEQQLRAVCGLPLGSPESLRPSAMANILGDLWSTGTPDWDAALALPEVKLHLYGKAEPRQGRKMGHLVAFGRDGDAAAATVLEARSRLTSRPSLAQE